MTDVLVVTEEATITVEAVLSAVLEIPADGQALVVPQTTAEVLTEAGTNEVLEVPPVVITLVELVAGPQGVPGVSEEAMKYSKKVDFITDDVFYKGEANPGALTSAPVWRISKTTIGIGGDMSEDWAEGSAGFIHAFDDRASYTY